MIQIKILASKAYDPATDPAAVSVADTEYPPDTTTLSAISNSADAFVSSPSTATRRMLAATDYTALFNSIAQGLLNANVPTVNEIPTRLDTVLKIIKHLDSTGL